MRYRWFACLLAGLLVSAPGAAAPEFVHCYDFGCKSRQMVRFDNAQWARIRALFPTAAASATVERQSIRRAVALMESFSGEIVGTAVDKAGNYPGFELPRQQDCIDESTNTWQYLVALDELGLLRHHAADRKYRRIVWFVTHWTAAIVEQASGARYAVDSWYRDNGELPLIQPLEDWRRKRDWPVEHNPELASGRG